MKKRILSVLLCDSLLFGTIGTNAISIGFEDLEQAETSSLEEDESNIYFEELEESQVPKTEEIDTVSGNSIIEADSYIDEYYFPEATDEGIQTLSLDGYDIMALSDDKYDNAESTVGFFKSADNVTYYGQSGISTGGSTTNLFGIQYYSLNWEMY